MTAANTISAQDAKTRASSERVHATTEKMASAAQTAVDVAAENLAHAEKALREAGSAVGEKVADTARHAQSHSEDALATVKTYINLYPLRSVGIALAAGYLLTSLVKR